MISGNSKGPADCKSQGLSGTPEQQPIGDRICCSAETCTAAPLWQQHFMPQPSKPMAPAANRLAPRTRTRAVHTAFSVIDRVLLEILFMVSYHTKYHIVLSIKMIKKKYDFWKSDVRSYNFLKFNAFKLFRLVPAYIKKPGCQKIVGCFSLKYCPKRRPNHRPRVSLQYRLSDIYLRAIMIPNRKQSSRRRANR